MNGERAKLTGLKGFLNDFPNQNGGVVTALVLILSTGAIVNYRLARGFPFPDGYDGWLIFLGTLAGVSTVGMIGKRATDTGYAEAKARGKAAVTVQASTVEVNSSAAALGATGAYPVQVLAAEPDAPLTHRDSERGDP